MVAKALIIAAGVAAAATVVGVGVALAQAELEEEQIEMQMQLSEIEGLQAQQIRAKEYRAMLGSMEAAAVGTGRVLGNSSDSLGAMKRDEKNIYIQDMRNIKLFGSVQKNSFELSKKSIQYGKIGTVAAGVGKLASIGSDLYVKNKTLGDPSSGKAD